MPPRILLSRLRVESGARGRQSDELDWFLKLGLQQRRADLGKVIDYQYVDYALARLGKR
ncbi:MAG: hypothetical protein WBW74_05005 [Xanthobacteraceae bacterium]